MPDYNECVEAIRKHLADIVELDDDAPLGEQVDLVSELGLASIEVMACRTTNRVIVNESTG